VGGALGWADQWEEPEVEETAKGKGLTGKRRLGDLKKQGGVA